MPLIPTPDLGANVKGYLRLRGKTQADLAELLGIGQQAISKKLNGSQTFRHSELPLIADFLGVTVGALYGEVASTA